MNVAPRPWPWALWGIVAVGLLVRIATLAIPSTVHPDELFQYLEIAHQQVFGYGVISWEQPMGMRSALLPALLAGPMALGAAIAPQSGIYLLLPRLAMMLASAMIIVSAWTLGARTSRRHALFAAIVVAIWYEFIGFAAHPLGETAGLVAATGAAALMFARDARRPMLVSAGALLALAFVLRFQYAPALLVLALFGGGTAMRARWMPILGGGATVLALSSLFDLAHGGWPFAWLVENVRQNLVLDKASGFGEAGPFAYLGVVETAWHWAAVPIVIAAYAGMKRQPALFWAAVVHVVFHSLIGHKEYRFILLTDAFAIILAAIGTVDLIDAAEARIGKTYRRALAVAALALWVGASAALAASSSHRPLWTARSTAMTMFAELRSDPRLCGIAITGLPISEQGGYVTLHRDVPIYLLDARNPDQRGAALRLAGAFDTMIVTPAHERDVPAGFGKVGCRSTKGEYVGNYVHPEDVAAVGGLCLYRRVGTCDAATQRDNAAMTINRALAR